METIVRIDSVTEIINFALWMFSRQTTTERDRAETIEQNDIGFNAPDAKAITNLMICLREGVKYSDTEMYKIAFTHLRPRLLKYKNQFKTYANFMSQQQQQ